LGNRPAAVAQFEQIGDTHRESGGFVPKAVAFYKIEGASKWIRARDQSRLFAAGREIAVGAGKLYADATPVLESPDPAGVRRSRTTRPCDRAECLVRLGGFPDGHGGRGR
jgi:hypothetical protein